MEEIIFILFRKIILSLVAFLFYMLLKNHEYTALKQEKRFCLYSEYIFQTGSLLGEI